MPVQATMFSRLLQHLPWADFNRAVRTHSMDKGHRVLDARSHLVALLAGQLVEAHGLRDIEAALSVHAPALKRRRIKPACRSTLADANKMRPAAAFEAVVPVLLAQLSPTKARQAREELRLIDSTLVTPGHGAQHWAHFQNGKIAAKVHVVFDPKAEVPVFYELTSGNTNDITLAKARMPIEPDATYVFDLGYYDFGFWADLDAKGCRFVTRLKKNTTVTLVAERPLTGGANILRDATVRLPERLARSRANPFGKPGRIVVVTIESGKTLTLFTNDLDSDAQDIAALYRQRWQIELFFRWIKQNLKIRRFHGRSANAVRLQIRRRHDHLFASQAASQHHRHQKKPQLGSSPASVMPFSIASMSKHLSGASNGATPSFRPHRRNWNSHGKAKSVPDSSGLVPRMTTVEGVGKRALARQRFYLRITARFEAVILADAVKNSRMLFTLPDHDKLYTALLARDASYEGRAYVGVTSTGIFCRLTCPARKPMRENCRFFASVAECMADGFRPCKRCHPLQPAAEADPAVKKLLDALEADPARRWGEEDVVRIGLDPSTVRRSFRRHFGMTFLEMARQERLRHGFQALADGARVIDAQIDAGFESPEAFRSAFARILGLPPAKLRKDGLLRADWIKTPLGTMIAICDAKNLHLLEFADRKALAAELKKLHATCHGDIGIGRFETHDRIEHQLNDFFTGKSAHFDLPLVMHGSAFTQDVWRELQRIGAGETRSYSEIAQAIDKPLAVRAVARANGANQIAIIIPCHRVIGADGSLTGYGGGLWRKQKLIEIEAQYR